MDRSLLNEAQEAHLRELMHSMVQPILELAKKNIEHNARKNEKLAEQDKHFEKYDLILQKLEKELKEHRKFP